LEEPLTGSVTMQTRVTSATPHEVHNASNSESRVHQLKCPINTAAWVLAGRVLARRGSCACDTRRVSRLCQLENKRHGNMRGAVPAGRKRRDTVARWGRASASDGPLARCVSNKWPGRGRLRGGFCTRGSAGRLSDGFGVGRSPPSGGAAESATLASGTPAGRSGWSESARKCGRERERVRAQQGRNPPRDRHSLTLTVLTP
jgi:hypothetical protein